MNANLTFAKTMELVSILVDRLSINAKTDGGDMIVQLM